VRRKLSTTGAAGKYKFNQYANSDIRKNIVPGHDVADLVPGVTSSATSSSRKEFSVSSLSTPKSTQVTSALSAELRSTEPTRGMRLSKDQTSNTTKHQSRKNEQGDNDKDFTFLRKQFNESSF
jgi:hypothetical protein